MTYNVGVKRAVLLVSIIALAACKSKEKDKPADPPAPAPSPVTQEPPPPPAPRLDATKFDKSCKVATDCVVVKSATCDACACSTEAIASAAMVKFDEANSTLKCPPPDLDKMMRCAPCPAQIAACEGDACVAKAK